MIKNNNKPCSESRLIIIFDHSIDLIVYSFRHKERGGFADLGPNKFEEHDDLPIQDF